MYGREHIILALSESLFQGHGPDGKLLLVVDENDGFWKLQSILLTLQQKEAVNYTSFVYSFANVLFNIYNKLILHDDRWVNSFEDISVLINLNGSFIERAATVAMGRQAGN